MPQFLWAISKHSDLLCSTSAPPQKADVEVAASDVCYGPIADTRFAPTLVRFAGVNRLAVASVLKANLVNANR